MAILAGYGFLKLNTDRAIFRVVYCFMMSGCIPFLLYLPYIYGDVLSISFGIVMFWAVSAYEHYEKKRYIALAACVAGVAVLARKNTWIILIGVGIYAVLVCLKKKKGQYLLAGVAILLTATLTVKAVDVMYEYRSGYPSGIGIPSILWIAMGLQETDGMAGVYNRYQQATFADHDFQQEPAAQEGREYIRERLKEFRENPSMMVDFSRESWRINGSSHCFPALKQQRLLIQMESRFHRLFKVCTMEICMKSYGSWPIITRAWYIWQGLYLVQPYAAYGGGKKRCLQLCGCR